MYHLYGPIGRVRGKDVFLTLHALKRFRERGISYSVALNVLRHPYKVLIDTRAPVLKGYRRLVYISRRHGLIIVVEENDNVVIVTSWRTSKDIDREIEKKIHRGEWLEKP